MKNFLVSQMLTFSLLVWSFGIHAELIDKQKYTVDTATGLDWLDLTETQGLSYSEVSAQLEQGGQLAGWSYATQQQLNELFKNAGLVKGFKTKENIEPVSKLLKLWGITQHRVNKEKGDKSSFLYGLPFVVKLPGKSIYRVYIGSIGKVGKIEKEGGLVLLNDVKATLSIHEKNVDTGSALVRKR
ncbi:MAG: hypothetical protein OQL06_05050 [Gammaproteobacteria bacterium]|nr:hypothetical protein [Gammaproteobacteria bacterium]